MCPVDIPLSQQRKNQTGVWEQLWRLKDSNQVEWRVIPDAVMTPSEPVALIEEVKDEAEKH